MRVMVISAHPDDMEVGCAGHEIVSVIATSARSGKLHEGHPLARVRENESVNAHEYLKTKPIFLRLDTGELLYSTKKFLEYLQGIFKEYAPDAVFTLSPSDVHPDHCALHGVVREFCLAKGVNTEYFWFEVCAGTTTPYPQTMKFIPTHYAPMHTAQVVFDKMGMILSHYSQNPKKLIESNKLLWEKRGQDCGVRLAEGYVRLTREGPLHPELAKWMIPSPHLPLIESLYGGEYICAKA